MGIVETKKSCEKRKGGKPKSTEKATGIKEVKKHMKGGSKVTVSAKAASVKKKTYPTTAEVLYPEAKCQRTHLMAPTHLQ